MAKNMAKLDNNIVINIEWCSDNTPESNVFVNIGDFPVSIGDTYDNGYFYRNGERVLTTLEYAFLAIYNYETQQEELNNSYNEGVNSI